MRTRWVKAAWMAAGGAMLAGTLAGCGHSIFTSGAPLPPGKAGPQFLYVTNNADSVVSEFTIDPKTGALNFESQTHAGSGAGAAGLVGTLKGGFLYVVNSQSSEIFGFSVNATTGVLTPTAQATVNTGAGSQPISLVLGSTSQFLYVADKANDLILQYSVNKKTGELTPLNPATVTTKPNSGSPKQTPVSITFSPLDNSVFVANQQAGTIQGYTVAKTGQLSKTQFVGSLNSQNGIPNWIEADPNNLNLYDADGSTTPPNGGAGGEVSVFQIQGGTFAKFLGAFTTGNLQGQPLALFVDPFFPFLYTANDGADNASIYSIISSGLSTAVTQGGFTSLGNVTTDTTGTLFYGLDTTDGLVFEGSINTTTGGVTSIPPGAVDTENPVNPGSKPFQAVVVQTPKSSK